ncbi:MAG: thioredoxin fold domain-containing protein [Deltaproteobacteria bacterium]|nr:thioredoxin fold domain-containing protein [Deltaproteobacteria bacterium]
MGGDQHHGHDELNNHGRRITTPGKPGVRCAGSKLFSKRKNNVLTKHQVKYITLILLVASLLGGWAVIARTAESNKEVPVKGMVTMVDLGATSCIPCKMMAPILEKLEKSYQGKAAIIFIDVWKNRDQAAKFGIRAIPTQIFFDKNGQEAFRHVGFMDENAIVQQLSQMGVK